mmetsp:Transcript_14686/g.45528  ORF Transcript_14686/g.45528 Transcript_14686/m.45528 type:complete len:211 (+) Transcript_14686:235-867(+)
MIVARRRCSRHAFHRTTGRRASVSASSIGSSLSANFSNAAKTPSVVVAAAELLPLPRLLLPRLRVLEGLRSSNQAGGTASALAKKSFSARHACSDLSSAERFAITTSKAAVSSSAAPIADRRSASTPPDASCAGAEAFHAGPISRSDSPAADDGSESSNSSCSVAHHSRHSAACGPAMASTSSSSVIGPAPMWHASASSAAADPVVLFAA